VLVGHEPLVDGVGQASFQAAQGLLAGLALGEFAPVVGLPEVGWRICTMAIRYRAWLSLRLPARDRRRRTTGPLEASMGAVPVCAAKWCLEGKRRMSPTSPSSLTAAPDSHRHVAGPYQSLAGA
jgi:hypothetical protein